MKPEKKQGPVALTTEPPCNRVEAIVRSAYFRSGGAGNGSLSARKGGNAPKAHKIAHRAPTGRLWHFRGNRGRVFVTLATMRQGLTHWDPLPWHRRQGGTIYVVRRDGLAITSEREGDYRHARYRQVTGGCLITEDVGTSGNG